jgi:phosphoribosylglycinamide formyltransferase-1
MTQHDFRIGVLASGAGTTLQAVIDACGDGRIAASVAVVITNNSGSGAEVRARHHGIPCVHLSGVTHPDDDALDTAIRDTLAAHEVDLVLLAGYMKKVGPGTLAAFERRVVNTHPSLLPAHGGRGMYGAHVHRAVLEAGESETGISVHLVDGEYDTGRVLAQHAVPVEPGDDVSSLAARVQQREREFLVTVLGRIASGEIDPRAHDS